MRELHAANGSNALFLSAEIPGRHVRVFFELTTEMGVVAKADLIADIEGIVTTVSQQHTGPFNTQAIYIIENDLKVVLLSMIQFIFFYKGPKVGLIWFIE